MTLRHLYRDLDGTLTDMSAYSPRLVTAQSRAVESAVGSWSVVLDDPNGELEIVGHRNWFIEETDSEDEDIIIWGGFTGAQTIARMQGDAHRKIGPDARVISVELYDANSYLARIIMKGSDTERPTETDVERMEWLLSTDEADAIHDVTTFMHTGAPVNMDAASYRGTYFGQIISDCSEQSGKNHYAFYRWHDSARKLTIWYGRDTANDYVSPFFLSNDPDDITYDAVDNGTATVWPLSEDATMERSPERQYCGCYMTGADSAGATYRHNAATHALIAGGTHQHRDMTAYRPLVKTLTKLKARADRVLLDVQDQDVRIKTTIYGVLQERVTLCKAGMLIKVKGTHWWPSVDDWHNCRVLTAEPRPFGPGNTWDIALELQVIDPGPDGVVDGPPPADYEADVFAGLQRSRGNDTDQLGPLKYASTYSIGGGGWDERTPVGPIDYIPGVDNPEHDGLVYDAIQVSAAMTVRIHARADVTGVYIPATVAVLNVYINGSIAGSSSVAIGPGFAGGTVVDVDLRDVHLAAGDIVSIDSAGSGLGDAIFWTNMGINDTYLQVGRGTILSTNGGATIMVGP